MKKFIYVAMLLFSCISFSSCEKEGEKGGNSNSLKNEIKEVWDDSHGTKITIQGKEITLPPDGEIWMWITELLAKDIIENDDATIVEACGAEVSSYKLYNDNGKYVLCVKIDLDREGNLLHLGGPSIAFDKTIEFHKTGWHWYDNVTQHGIKKVVLPPNTTRFSFSQEIDETDSLDDLLEEVYFGGNDLYDIYVDIPTLKSPLYIPERSFEYEGDTPYYDDNHFPGSINLLNYNMESLEIPEGWSINIDSETLKSLKLNGKAALPGFSYKDCVINCPKLEKLVLNDETRYLDGYIYCPSLKTFELPKKLIRLVTSIECDIESLTIPENVNYIYAHTFGNIKSLYFKPATPPSIYGGLEDTLRHSDVTIYVPSESYNTYMKEDFFKNLNTVPYEF